MLIHCDGATRRICFVPEGHPPQVVELPIQVTSNQGEYLAIIDALEWAYEKGYACVTILSDSQLAINQITRKYALRHPVLATLVKKVWAWQELLEEVKFVWIPREENKAGICLEKLVKGGKDG